MKEPSPDELAALAVADAALQPDPAAEEELLEPGPAEDPPEALAPTGTDGEPEPRKRSFHWQPPPRPRSAV